MIGFIPDQWKESIIVSIHKKEDKTECINYRGISLLSTSYKIISNSKDSQLGRLGQEDEECKWKLENPERNPETCSFFAQVHRDSSCK